VALLLTRAIRPFNTQVTRPPFGIAALFKFINALLTAGLRCSVKTELGQNPSVLLKNSVNFFVSKSWSTDNAVTNATVVFLVVFLE
jgi:hypothetical protein